LKNRFQFNQKGFTTAELLVALVIGSILMTTAAKTFTSQTAVIQTENLNTEIRGYGRLALEKISKDLTGAGYGLPPGEGITSISATQITFLVNSDNVKANITVSISNGDNSITVNDATGFANGDSISVYNSFNTTVPVTHEKLTIIGIGSNTINVSPNIANAYTLPAPLLTNKYHTVQIQYNAGNQRITKTIDGGASLSVAENVTAFSFTYRDGFDIITTDTQQVRKIGINMSLVSPKNNLAKIDLNNFINVRNMSS